MPPKDDEPKIPWDAFAAGEEPDAATGATGDTDSGTDTPPPPPTREWTKPGGQLGQIHDAVETILGGVALAFFTAGDFHCYTVISERAPVVAEVWTDAAKQSPPVKKALLRLLEGGQWGQVFFATASMVIPIMDHHGMWPLPNPWSILTTPADHNPGAATAAAAAAAGGAFDGGVDAPDLAERQRREAEERRKRQRTEAE